MRTDWRAMPSRIVTERLTLGAWHDEDLAHYAAMTNERDPRAAAAPAGGRVDESIVRARLVQRQRELNETGIALLAVRVAGVFAGYCGLTIGHASLDEPEIAYELLQRFQGRGYATEAAQAIVAAACQTGRRRLWASVRPWNASSFRVLTKVGFTATDHEVIDAWGRSVWWTRVLDGEVPALLAALGVDGRGHRGAPAGAGFRWRARCDRGQRDGDVRERSRPLQAGLAARVVCDQCPRVR